jgi:uncharacterized protein (DUF4415 family)
MNDKPNFVEYTPRRLTEEERAELRALAERPDSEIDFSDIPATAAEDWEGAIRNPFLYPPVRMSADVVEYFQKKVGDKGSIMMEINHVLLDHIAAEKKKAAKKAG